MMGGEDRSWCGWEKENERFDAMVGQGRMKELMWSGARGGGDTPVPHSHPQVVDFL